MTMHFSYEQTLHAAQKVNWQVDDLIGGDKVMDFTKRLMPESLARVERLNWMTETEKRVMNQIRGHNYLYLFGLVEEFILPFVMDHARPQLNEDDWRTRAFLQFASEEAKHIHLFKRFREEFINGFGTEIDVIGPAEDVANAVLAHDPLSVALVILHIEWMTQRHYTDSVKDDMELDSQFKSLLKHHWMEEAQHARLDTMMVEALIDGRTSEQRAQAMDGYLEIGGLLDEGLAQQTRFDLDAFQRATGRMLTDAEYEQAFGVQQQAMRWTFLGSGMTHPSFMGSLEDMGAEHRARIEDVAPAFC